jgi:CBS domain containing-hemolysin-like protein
MIPLLAVLYAFQFVIAAGFAAFATLSRLHEEAAFPAGTRGAVFARHMHRGRLHLVLTLLGLEAVLLSCVAVILHRWIASGGSPLHALAAVAAIAASVIAVTVAGFGVATASPTLAAVAVSWPLMPVYLAFRPVSELFLRVVGLVFPNLPREIASPFFLFPPPRDTGAEGFIGHKGSSLIRSIQEFGVKKVREVMVPRIDIFALDAHTTLSEARRAVSAAGHSRVPVFDGAIDRIVGMLHVKDLLKVPAGNGEARLDRLRIVREAHFVPESKKIDALLREFQREKKHMAVVVDEYGGTSGIVTLEDILEEIVGEILDEYDHEPPLVRRIAPRQYAAAGRSPIDRLNAALGISLPADDVDTLGGFIYNLVGRVPEEGEEVSYEGIRFRVGRLEGQRIVEVIVWLSDRALEGDS